MLSLQNAKTAGYNHMGGVLALVLLTWRPTALRSLPGITCNPFEKPAKAVRLSQQQEMSRYDCSRANQHSLQA